MRSAIRYAARGERGLPRRKWTVVTVLVLGWAALAGMIATPAAAAVSSMETMLAPWEGFVAVAGEPYGAATNPASLSWLDNHVLRAQHVSPQQAAVLPGARGYVYLEPDTGLGAGQLAYVAAERGDRRVKQYVYSAAWRGGDTAFGFSIRHVTLENVLQPNKTVTTWATDLGYRGQWGQGLAVGVVARNVLLMFGDVARNDMPTEFEAGMAFDLGGGLVLAADYIFPQAGDPDTGGYRYGLEGRFGRVLARLGQEANPAGVLVTYGGLGYMLDAFRLDATVGQGAQGRVISVGLSMYF